MEKQRGTGKTAKRDIKQEALRFLGYRQRTVHEVIMRLKEKSYGEGEIDEAIQYLLELSYLNDEKYCEDYIQYARSKGKGKHRIKRELIEKGLNSEQISSAFEGHIEDISEFENALLQGKKLLPSHGMVDDRLKGKIGRKLYGLGYEKSIIFQVMEKLSEQNFDESG